MNTPAPVSSVAPTHAAKGAAQPKHGAGKQAPAHPADAFAALMESLSGATADSAASADASALSLGTAGEPGEGSEEGEGKPVVEPAATEIANATATGATVQRADPAPLFPWPPQLAMPMQGATATTQPKGLNAPSADVLDATALAASAKPQSSAAEMQGALLPARDPMPLSTAQMHKSLPGIAEQAGTARATPTLAAADSLPIAPATVNLPTASAAAPAPVYEAVMQARPGESPFAGELAAQVHVMLDGDMHSARLELNPPELGPIRIEFNLQGSSADISFAAAHATTREGIEHALPELRELLAQQGVQLGEAGISAGAGQPGAQQQQAHREEAAQRFSAPGAGTRQAAGSSVEGQAVAVRVSRSRGALDLYA